MIITNRPRAVLLTRLTTCIQWTLVQNNFRKQIFCVKFFTYKKSFIVSGSLLQPYICISKVTEPNIGFMQRIFFLYIFNVKKSFQYIVDALLVVLYLSVFVGREHSLNKLIPGCLAKT